MRRRDKSSCHPLRFSLLPPIVSLNFLHFPSFVECSSLPFGNNNPIGSIQFLDGLFQCQCQLHPTGDLLFFWATCSKVQQYCYSFSERESWYGEIKTFVEAWGTDCHSADTARTNAVPGSSLSRAGSTLQEDHRENGCFLKAINWLLIWVSFVVSMIKLWSLLLLETNRKIVKNSIKGSTAQRIRLHKDTKTLWLVFLYLNSSLPFKITEAKDLSKTVVILYSKSFLLLCCNKKKWMFVNLSWTGIDRNSQAWNKKRMLWP